MTQPVNSPTFWRRRLLEWAATQPNLHQVIWHTSSALWDWTQRETGRILREHLKPGEWLLDAGCGLGSVVEVLPPGVGYVGVDISPELIEIARLRHKRQFCEADLQTMDLHAGRFDWALLRQVKGTIQGNCGEVVWGAIHDNLRRHAKQIIYISCPEEYGLPAPYTIEECSPIGFRK